MAAAAPRDPLTEKAKIRHHRLSVAGIERALTPGLEREQVRRILGRPARTQLYELQQQEVWDWRWVDGALNASFSVTFDEDGRVLAAAVGPDPLDTATGGR